MRSAVEHARAAGVGWGSLGIERRLVVLSRCAELLEENTEKLTEAYVADGFSRSLAERFRQGLFFGSAAHLRAVARELVRTVVDKDDESIGEIIARRADGVVIVATQGQVATVALINLLEILLVGNVVVLRLSQPRSHVQHLFQTLLSQALEEHSVRGVVSFIDARTRELVDITRVCRVDTVVFFGSRSAGDSISEVCRSVGTKFVLELETSDSMVAWRDAPATEVAESAADGFNLSGAPCISPRRVLAHADVYDDVLGQVVEHARARARPISADPQAGVLTAMPRAYLDEVRSAAMQVGHVAIGGDLSDDRDPSMATMAPLVIRVDERELASTPSAALLDRDIRAPIVMVIRCEREPLASMLSLLRRIPFRNRVSLWTRDTGVATTFIRHLSEHGLLILNRTHVEDTRFGGLSGGRGASGGAFGESLLFWQRTSTMQTIRCPGMEQSVLAALGAETLHGSIICE